MRQMKPRRPLARYLGGKFLLADWIVSHFGPHDIYTELFGGMLSPFFAKKPCRIEVVNDIDDDVRNVFDCLRDDVKKEKLKRMLYYTPYTRSEFNRAHERCDDSLERARRFFIRSWFGYGALKKHKTGFRTYHVKHMKNQCREFIRWQEELDIFASRLRRAIVPNEKDALKGFATYDSKHTLHYVDPPYQKHSDESTRSVKYRFDFDKREQHVELIDVLESLKGMVILSGYRNSLYDRRLKSWKKVDKPIHTQGGANKTRQTRIETIFLNKAAVAALEK